MIVIDHNSKTPVYEQIKVQILSLITSGALSPGDKLPSLRTLAADLSLNFNTIKKVFAQLESDGVIVTVQGKGCFVCGAPSGPQREQLAQLEAFDKAVAAGVSNSQLYKQAGNAVTVNVAEAIGRRLREIEMAVSE